MNHRSQRRADQPEARHAGDRESARRRLRESGLRCTSPRLHVLLALDTANRPLSHAELQASLADHGLDRATIYRNLADMVARDLVRRTDLGDKIWRFESRRGDAAHVGDHPHFVCTDCGTVECLPDVEIRVSRRRNRTPRAIAEETVNVQLSGQCDDCR